MSRHGYVDEEAFPGDFALYRQRVHNACAGRRGQRLLRELAAALDAMPVKELGRGGLVDEESGKACTLGVVALQHGVDSNTLMNVGNCDHNEFVAKLLNIAECMAAEIAYQNDERQETDAQRWVRMRQWVAEQIKPESA